MSKYDQSPNYRPSARPNRITDNRPAEFRESGEPYEHYSPGGQESILLCILFILIGIIIVCTVNAFLERQQSVPFVPISCNNACHQEKPIIKNLAQYRRIHQGKPVAKDMAAVAQKEL